MQEEGRALYKKAIQEGTMPGIQVKVAFAALQRAWTIENHVSIFTCLTGARYFCKG